MDMKQTSTNLDRIFSALSDPTRRAIIEQLLEKSCTVSELAVPYTISKPAVIKHLHVLERAGLISKEKNGRQTLVAFNSSGLNEAKQFLLSIESSGSKFILINR